MTRQEAAIQYLEANYLQFNRLRYDVVGGKLQIRDANNCWREMSKQEINSAVCACAQEFQINVTAREIITVLQSNLIPSVHPLREYVLACKDYNPSTEIDWIDLVAQKVTVKPSLLSDDRPKGLLDRTSCCETTCSTPKSHELFQGPRTLRDRTEGAERCLESLSEPCERSLSECNERSLSECNERSLSEPCERSKADRLWRTCFKKWFVAMVASWMKDEVVNHQVLVLIGRQGIFKTTWLERLIPPQLRAYCCKLANTTQINKDDRLRLAEFGLINLDELDSMSSRELNTMKSIITASDVNERAAYGYTKERKIRLASFCASSNRREFLTDITGNRRWLPFEVESITNPFETILPYERMYAQARYLIDYGFNYWFDLDDIATLEEHNEVFRAQESEEQLLPILFDVPAEGRGEFMTTAQISERLVTYGNIKKPMPLNRLGVLMGTAGYKDVRAHIGGIRTRGWLVYQRHSDEIDLITKQFKE